MISATGTAGGERPTVITTKDKHGTYGKARKNSGGPPLDRRSAKHYAIVQGVWSKGFDTRREAEAEERRMKTQATDRGVELGRDRITLADFITTVWLPDAERRVGLGKLDENTLEAYRWQLEKRIVPGLGGLKLRDIKPQTLQAFYLERKKTHGWEGAKSMINLHAIVSNVLSLAVDRGVLVKNPAKAKGVRPQERNVDTDSPGRKPVALTPDEVRALLEATKDDRLAAAWRLLVTGGLRRGEALGLEWRDIDLDAGRVQLRRTWKSLTNTRKCVVAPIKTGRPREISIDAQTVAMLRAHHEAQLKERAAAGELWHELDVVFATELGEHIRPATFSRRFARLLECCLRAGHLHELRHTAVTLAVSGGMPISVAAERFGVPKVMLGIYSHVDREQQDAAAHMIAAAIDGGSKPMRRVRTRTK